MPDCILRHIANRLQVIYTPCCNAARYQACVQIADLPSKGKGMHLLRYGRLFLAMLALAGLASCGGPPKPKPTLLKATVSAQADVNPDARGRPSPVTVRVYGLKSRAVFDSADFFALYDKDRETLGGDLVEKEEFQLKPGESRTIDKPLPPEVTYVGVFAAFRDLERAQWRMAIAVPPQQVSNLRVSLSKSSITIAK